MGTSTINVNVNITFNSVFSPPALCPSVRPAMLRTLERQAIALALPCPSSLSSSAQPGGRSRSFFFGGGGRRGPRRGTMGGSTRNGTRKRETRGGWKRG